MGASPSQHGSLPLLRLKRSGVINFLPGGVADPLEKGGVPLRGSGLVWVAGIQQQQ